MLNQTIPQYDRHYADEGIEAEIAAYDMLAGRTLSTTDPDMIEGAQIFCDAVLNVCSDLSKVIIQGILACPDIAHNVIGSPDVWFFDKAKNQIHIFDYKYGHNFIDAFENWQLICYASSVLSNTNHAPDVSITLWIIQPRNYNYQGVVRKWEVDEEKLQPYFDVLREGAIVANSDNAPLVTGSHCYRCHAAHACDQLRRVGMSALDLADGNLEDVSIAKIGFMLSLLEDGISRLKALELGLKEDVSYRIRSGEAVDGYTLAPSYTNKRWAKPESEILAIGDLYGINLKSEKLITPTQAEKKGFPIEGFSERLAKSPELVSSKKLLSRLAIDNISNI